MNDDTIKVLRAATTIHQAAVAAVPEEPLHQDVETHF
jgi:hypothetical protein